jgi:hypothetical protein
MENVMRIFQFEIACTIGIDYLFSVCYSQGGNLNALDLSKWCNGIFLNFWLLFGAKAMKGEQEWMVTMASRSGPHPSNSAFSEP